MISKRMFCLLPFLRFCFIFFAFNPLMNAQADSTADCIQKILDQGWALQSRMHIDLNNLDKAIILYEEAVALAPQNAEAKWRLAEVIFKRSEEIKNIQKRKRMVERTIQLTRQALTLNPRSVGGMYWGGVAHARQAEMAGLFTSIKKINQAKTYLHQAIRTDPDHRLSILSGTVLALIYAELPWPLKDLDQALELAVRSAEKDPHLTIASLALAKIYLVRENNGLAESELQRCLNTRHPTYIWDAELYDWPEARTVLAGIKQPE